MTIGPEAMDFLFRLRQELWSALKLANMAGQESALLCLLETKKNRRFEILNKAAISSHSLSPKAQQQLEEGRLVFGAAEAGRLAISARGIVAVESDQGKFSSDKLIDFLDKKEFSSLGETKPLTDKERVIILTLLASRSLSKDQPIDLHEDPAVKEALVGILYKCYDLLKEKRAIVNLKRDALLKSVGNEHPVSDLIRHTDALPRKVKGLFKSYGKQQYSLDLVQDGFLDVRQTSYLFRQAFRSKIVLSDVEKIAAFCHDVANNDCLGVFDVNANPFLSSSWDDYLRDALWDAADAASE